MNHERTPSILRRAYNIEQNSDVKSEIVRITTSLMADNSGATEQGIQVSEEILQSALNDDDLAVKTVAESVIKNREAANI